MAHLIKNILICLSFLSVALTLFTACAVRSQQEKYRLEVTLAKTTPGDLVRLMGPPIERNFVDLGSPYERLHFNVPFDRIIYVRIIDSNGDESEKIIRGKNVISFRFLGGLLESVD
jgi:hypothetical protein